MTALPFTAFGLFGFMYGIWQVLLAELQRSMGLSDGALGAAISIGFVGSLPSMFFGGKLVDRFGAERVISSTGGLMALDSPAWQSLQIGGPFQFSSSFSSEEAAHTMSVLTLQPSIRNKQPV